MLNLRRWINKRVKAVLSNPEALRKLAETKAFEVWIDEHAGVVRDIILDPSIGKVPDLVDAELDVLMDHFAKAFEEKAEELIYRSLLEASRK